MRTEMVRMMVKMVLMEIMMIDRKMMFSMHEEESCHIDNKKHLMESEVVRVRKGFKSNS